VRQPPRPEDDHRRPHSSGPPSPSPRSPLAIAALVLALVPCCPPVSLLGAILGLVALRRIQLANGPPANRRLAIAAVLIGIGVSLFSGFLMNTAARSIDHRTTQMMVEHVEQAIREAAEGREHDALQRWSSAAQEQITAEDLREFGTATQSRHGRLQRFSITSQSRSGTLLQQRFDVAGLFIFERRKRTGAASFEVRPSRRGLLPEIRMESLLIEDREHGNLRLPAGRNTADTHHAPR
jgi:hypothetical protein